MKILVIIALAVGFCSCKKTTNPKEEIKLIEKHEKIDQEKSTKVESVSFTDSKIASELHFGHKYEFNIEINTSENLDILKFCKENFHEILKDKIENKEVVINIIKELESEKKEGIDIDKDPTGLRLGTATKTFDTVEVEIYLKEQNLLFLDLKYYTPL